MEKKETKKLIKEMINQVDEEKTLRRIYLIIIIITGASHQAGPSYFMPRQFFINSSIHFNFSGEDSAIAFNILLANSFSVILSLPRLIENLSSSFSLLKMFSSPPSPVLSQISFTSNSLQISVMTRSVSSVSYTQLDVYKRQEQYSSNGL